MLREDEMVLTYPRQAHGVAEVHIGHAIIKLPNYRDLHVLLLSVYLGDIYFLGEASTA